MLGALLKMKLVGFQDSTFTKPTGFVYVAQVNPESYTFDHAVVLNKEQAQGNGGAPDTFAYMRPRKLTFDFLFDATGALVDSARPNPADATARTGVWAQLELFKRTVYAYVGHSHRPPYVLLQWGTLIFQCQLESLSINYKLFSPEGVPLRATAKATFNETIADTLLTRLNNALSSDLTHVRTVQAGDTLPLLCHQVYGDAALYREVARVNQLANFRSLRVGQQLAFPPLVPAEATA